MTEKTVTGLPSGEYLLFQKDVVPEIGSNYTLGAPNRPFSNLYTRSIPLTVVPYKTSETPFVTNAGAASNWPSPSFDIGVCYMAYSTSAARYKFYFLRPTIGTYSTSTGWTVNIYASASLFATF